MRPDQDIGAAWIETQKTDGAPCVDEKEKALETLMAVDTRMKDKVAIVVGAGSSGEGIGIGQAIAQLLALEGARLVLVDLNEDRAAVTEQEISKAGGVATTVIGDISDPALSEKVVAAAMDQFGRIDVLVNSAAFTPLLGVAETSPELFSKVLAINTTGPFLMTRAVLPAMISGGGGSIINIGTISSVRSSFGGQAAYASSKSALLGLMIDIANAHGRDGIRVNTVSPGMIDTPLRRKTMQDMGLDPESYPFGPQGSLGYAGDAWDIARAVLFLASDDARFITGVHLPVDGGLITRHR